MQRVELISLAARQQDGSVPFPNATAPQVDALIKLLPDLPNCRLDYETPDGQLDSIIPEQLCAQTPDELLEINEIMLGKIPELYGSNLTLVFNNGDA